MVRDYYLGGLSLHVIWLSLPIYRLCVGDWIRLHHRRSLVMHHLTVDIWLLLSKNWLGWHHRLAHQGLLLTQCFLVIHLLACLLIIII